MPDVTITRLHKDFGDTTVLHEVDIDIKDGEFFTLLGPSGCGKSTTLSCLAGLEKPSGGRISIGDEVFFDEPSNTYVPPEARNLGMVFQSYALWPHMTLEQNDEPLSNLDAKLREQARVWLKRLQADLGITTIYVTHDQEEALAMSDRIAVMSTGHLLQVGTPEEIYERPASAEVAAFIGKSNFIDGTIIAATPEAVSVELDAGVGTVQVAGSRIGASGDLVTIAFRPERATLVAADAAAPEESALFHGEVLTASYVGSRVEYGVRVGNRTLLVDHYRGGYAGEVSVAVPADAIRVYPRADVVPEDIEELMAATV